MTQRKSAKINSLLQKNATYFYIRFGILQDWNTPFPLLIPSSVAKQTRIQKFSQKSIRVGNTVLPPPSPPDTQCGNFRFFLSFRFYVKPMLLNVEVQNLTFQQILRRWIFIFMNFCTFKSSRNLQINIIQSH